MERWTILLLRVLRLIAPYSPSKPVQKAPEPRLSEPPKLRGSRKERQADLPEAALEWSEAVTVVESIHFVREQQAGARERAQTQAQRPPDLPVPRATPLLLALHLAESRRQVPSTLGGKQGSGPGEPQRLKLGGLGRTPVALSLAPWEGRQEPLVHLEPGREDATPGASSDRGVPGEATRFQGECDVVMSIVIKS